MEHIRQHDWFLFNPPDAGFLEEKDIDNCTIERIIANTFHDPLISSDSEDERSKPTIDWGEIFKKKDNFDRNNKLYIPCLRPAPPYPKLSALNSQQHYVCLKVLSHKYPDVLPGCTMYNRPNKTDFKLYNELQEVYKGEQKEFFEWAQMLWTTLHCGRALRPKPVIEMVYEAHYKMKAKELECFPKMFYVAAQISLSNEKNSCKLIHEKDLITIKTYKLPKVEYPEPLENKFSIMRPCPVPEPCNKHPCWFVLPNEKTKSVLPLTEVHRELAQYAVENGTQCVVSESALKCLLETDRDWLLPVSVCEVIDADGEKHYVKVIGSEFSVNKRSSMIRSYLAFRHLVEYAIVPAEEKAKVLGKTSRSDDFLNLKSNDNKMKEDYSSDDDDEEKLIIDDPLDGVNEEEDDVPLTQIRTRSAKRKDSGSSARDATAAKKKSVEKDQANILDFFSCSCRETLFEIPPQRSYRKWKIKNVSNGDSLSFIVHASHKMRNSSGEVIVEPIPEYQIELGGSRQSDEKLRSIALSLSLRKSASLLNVRVDSSSGEVVTIDNFSHSEFTRTYGNFLPDASKVIYESLSSIKGLMPGNYILNHEISHGKNAILYATKNSSNDKLSLEFSFASMSEVDEAKSVKVPPVLTPVLLPVHKLRKILPCAFTPFPNMIARESKKPILRNKAPPQALKWPKRSRKRRNKNNNN